MNLIFNYGLHAFGKYFAAIVAEPVAPSTVVAPHAQVEPPLIVAKTKLPPEALPVVIATVIEPVG